MLVPIILLCAAIVRPSLAIYADEANHIDFYHSFVGFPRPGRTFFHKPYAGSKGQLIYTLSEKNVLAAVNPKDGAVIWRQILSSNTTAVPGLLTAALDHSILASAVQGTVNTWRAFDGKAVGQTRFEDSQVQDIKFLDALNGQDTPAQRDLLVVIDGKNGGYCRHSPSDTGCQYLVEEVSGDQPLAVSISDKKAYSIALSKGMLKGYKVRVSSFDLADGKILEKNLLSSDNDVSATEDILYVGDASLPVVAWVDSSRSAVKINILGTNQVYSFDMKRSGAKPDHLTVVAPQYQAAKPHLLVHAHAEDTHWADIIHLDTKSSKVRKAYQMPKAAGRGAFSASFIDQTLYFTRITNDEVTLISSESQNPLSQWPRKGAVDAVQQPEPDPIHATSEVVPKSDSSFAVRAAVFYSSGDWVLIRNGEMSWQRYESLASIVRAEWMETTKKDTGMQNLDTGSDMNLVSAYYHRVGRHIEQLVTMKPVIMALPKAAQDWLRSILGAGSASTAREQAFGFDRAIIVVTENDHVLALNPLKSGKVIWNFHINAFGVNEGLNCTTVGSPTGAYTALMGGLSDRINTLKFGDFLPPEREEHPHLRGRHSNISYGLVEGNVEGKRFGQKAWSFQPKSGQTVTHVAYPYEHEPVASIGKALGDRRVLYKYLNPNAILITASHTQKNEMSVSLLDSISGTILYTANHKGVDVSRPISSAISENWIAYSFTSETFGTSASKGYMLVVAEMYESNLPNDRGPIGQASNQTLPGVNLTPTPHKPHVISQTFHLPEEISTMAVTQTTQGITSRQLLVGLSRSRSVVGIPHHFLDPRRPVDRDPRGEEQEEGLMRYQPMIDFDAKLYLNHRNEIVGLRKIITAPSDMESTSLVFAYGIDVFGTRVSPSFAFDILGSNFNKIQLVLTVVALTFGVFVVAPLIKRKQTNSIWQS